MNAGSQLKSLVVTSVLVGAIAAGGYGLRSHLFEGSGAVQAAPAPAPRPVPVSVVEVQKSPVRLWSEFSGRLSAVDSVELRPRVSGTITEIRFEDGQRVEKDDILVVIDPRPFAAAVAEAKAEVEVWSHEVELAEKQRVRAESLVGKGHVSKSVLDERVNDHTVAASQLKSAKAKLAQAEIDHGYAYVRAPISGRLSRAEITEGNLVEAGPNAPVLTSIVSTGEIYADFDVDERTYLSHVHDITSGGGELSAIPVDLIIDAGELRVYRGHIQSFDNQVDPATGTIRARAIFSNQDGSLLPGLFAEVRLGSPDVESLVLLGAEAISTDQDRKFVYLVDADGKVLYREVSLGTSVEGQRVITQGLDLGERVIVEGVMKVRPGMTVEPRLVGEQTTAAD